MLILNEPGTVYFSVVQIHHKNPLLFLGAFSSLLALNFIISVHHFAVAYVNSSFLGEFFTPEQVSIVYIASSLVVVCFFIFLPHIVSAFGTWRVFVGSIPLLGGAMYLLGVSTSVPYVVLFFVLQSTLIFFLRYTLDLYLESLSEHEGNTGNTRGLFTTAGNIGVLVGPLVASLFVVETNFTPLYTISALILIPAFFIALTSLRRITPTIQKEISLLKATEDIFCCRVNIRSVMVVYFLMNVFNAFIVIYAPLYLFETGGIPWQVIGGLTALALTPYLLLEVPLGFLADRFFGEKEIMLGGLAILGLSLVLLSSVPLAHFLLWSFFFITTRVGAAMVEIATESYFFKQVTEQDAALISAYRTLWPLANVLTPLAAFLVLPLLGLQNLFAFFGIIILLGIIPTLRLVDTK